MNTDMLVLFLIFKNVLALLDDNVDEECQWFLDVKSSASGCCLAFAKVSHNTSI